MGGQLAVRSWRVGTVAGVLAGHSVAEADGRYAARMVTANSRCPPGLALLGTGRENMSEARPWRLNQGTGGGPRRCLGESRGSRGGTRWWKVPWARGGALVVGRQKAGPGPRGGVGMPALARVATEGTRGSIHPARDRANRSAWASPGTPGVPKRGGGLTQVGRWATRPAAIQGWGCQRWLASAGVRKHSGMRAIQPV